MAENPSHTLLTESMDRLSHGEFEEFGDIWRHEGLKKLVEHGLYRGGQNELGRLILKYFGGGPVNDPRLRTNIGGKDLDGPLGLAPGWDKTGKTIQAWQALGAHHITVGGVTLFPQAGNRMPRLRTMDSQLGDHGVDISLNAFGFWNPGAEKVVYNIQKQREMSSVNIPIIIQVTLNKEIVESQDRQRVRDTLIDTIKRILPVADGVSLGLSSPNTKGMRETQDEKDFISDITAAAAYTVKNYDENILVIFKGDGDGGEERLERYCNLATYRARTCDVLELINTTRDPKIWTKYGMNPEKIPGGLAGADRDYQAKTIEAIRYVYEGVGDTIDIIGTGGADSPTQVLTMIENGASAVGVNSSVRKLGLGVMKYLEKGLIKELDDQYPDAKTLDQIIGTRTARGVKANVERHDYEWHFRRRNEEWMRENPIDPK
jgi:dihydroorotate dehydrogenase (fumarate)